MKENVLDKMAVMTYCSIKNEALIFSEFFEAKNVAKVV